MKEYLIIQIMIIFILGGASLISLYSEGYYIGFFFDIILQCYLMWFYVIRELKKK